MYRLAGIVVLGAAVLLGGWVSDSQAVPSLGVGSSFGYVNGSDPYQTYWGASVTGPALEDGFIIGPSGSSLHVFTNLMGVDIYILTTDDVRSGNSITFNGGGGTIDAGGVFRSYRPTPYFGINLGLANGWSTLPDPPFNPPQFRYLDVSVAYTGTIGPDQWIFAAADTNGLAGLQAESTRVQVNGRWRTYGADTFTNISKDDSSPKTTSARGWQVPEAGALMLFATGLVGLVGFRRTRRMK